MLLPVNENFKYFKGKMVIALHLLLGLRQSVHLPSKTNSLFLLQFTELWLTTLT